MRLAALLAGLLSLASAASALDSVVTVADDRVRVVANRTPLPEVLDRLSRQTGMKVVYEGGTPRALVTTRIEQATPAEAVIRVLDGLGVGYALRTDRSGTRVEVLLVMTPGGPTASATAPGPSPRSRAAARMRSSSDGIVEQDADEDEPDAPDEAPPGPGPGQAQPAEASTVPEKEKPGLSIANPAEREYSVSPFAPKPQPLQPSAPPAAPPSPSPPPPKPDSD